MEPEELKEMRTKLDDVHTDVAVIKDRLNMTGKIFMLSLPFILTFAGWLTLRVVDLPTKADLSPPKTAIAVTVPLPKEATASIDFVGPPHKQVQHDPPLDPPPDPRPCPSDFLCDVAMPLRPAGS